MLYSERLLDIAKSTPEKLLSDAETEAWGNLCRMMVKKAKEGGISLLVNTTAVEGAGYNLRSFLLREGFTIIPQPQKRVLILWNC